MSISACGGDGEGEGVAPEPEKETQQPSNQPTDQPTDQPSDPKPEKTFMTFKAGYDGDDNISKTAISGKTGLLFSAGDEITVYDGTILCDFKCDIETGTSATCNFQGFAFESPTYHALYCSYDSRNIDEVYAAAFIWDQQTPVVGSFDSKSHIMVASTTPENPDYFKFKTVNAFLRFTAPRDLNKVEVIGEGIAGNVSITPSAGSYNNFSVMVDWPLNTITMEGEMKADKDYYISVAPGTYADGITIKLVASNGDYAEYTTKPNLEIKSNSLRTFNLANVRFKILCDNLDAYLENCPSDEVNYIELADYEADDVNNALRINPDKKVYIVLPEKGVTTIPNSAFSHRDNLVGIDIPETVTSIGMEAFLFCTSLVLKEIPSSVNSIGDLAFFACTGFKELTIKGTPELHFAIFNNCSPDLKVIVNEATYLEYGDVGKEYHDVMEIFRPEVKPNADLENLSEGSKIN